MMWEKSNLKQLNIQKKGYEYFRKALYIPILKQMSTFFVFKKKRKTQTNRINIQEINYVIKQRNICKLFRPKFKIYVFELNIKLLAIWITQFKQKNKLNVMHICQ